MSFQSVVGDPGTDRSPTAEKRCVGGKNTNKKKGESFSVNKATASGRGLPSHFLPYDDPYEQDENKSNDGSYDALLVHPAMQMGKSNLEKPDLCASTKHGHKITKVHAPTNHLLEYPRHPINRIAVWS